jgi:3-methyl-2-oxobutanoate hydroxymethyltransferase
MSETTTELSKNPRVTLKALRAMAATSRKIAVLTCYDALTAQLLWRGGVRVLLVGDSAAMVLLGHESSLPIELDFLLTLTAAVRRGAPDAFVMGDMPFGSYQCSDDDAMRAAVKLLKAGADAVKLEVGESDLPLVKRMADAGVPVVAHIGWRPQQAKLAGVRTAVVAGKTRDEVTALVKLAQGMEKAGAVMLLIEQCTEEVSSSVVKSVSIPVIGCGAGPACHGHVVVLQDLLGMTDRHPSFVKPVAQLGQSITDAAGAWARLVESGQYLASDHPYHMSSKPRPRRR